MSTYPGLDKRLGDLLAPQSKATLAEKNYAQATYNVIRDLEARIVELETAPSSAKWGKTLVATFGETLNTTEVFGTALGATNSTADVGGTARGAWLNTDTIPTVALERRALVTWAELELQGAAARQAWVSWAEMELVDVGSPTPPVTLFEDGYENQSIAAYAGGAGGRHASCDCDSNCDGVANSPLAPMDSWQPDGFGNFFRRTVHPPNCVSNKASCNGACELLKEWSSFRLGTTDYIAHRMRVNAPYTNQAGFCLFSQFGYGNLKYNGMGLNLVGTNLHLFCNLGYSAAPPTHYGHADSYQINTGNHSVAVGEWHDYVWQITYATIYGTGTAGGSTVGGQTLAGTHTVQGHLKVYHRLPYSTSVWTVLFDSLDSHAGGVPTRQWGYHLNGTSPSVDDRGLNTGLVPISTDSYSGVAGSVRRVVDKLGVYRSSPVAAGGINNNTLSVDHWKHATAASFANAEAYLNWETV